MFEDCIVTDAEAEDAERQICEAMARYAMNRREAAELIVRSLSEIITEDAIAERQQWQPRLAEYVYVYRQREAEYAALPVPGLAEHTAAACDTIQATR